jgi:branched-chain amino acid transport system substrate-binding protein
LQLGYSRAINEVNASGGIDIKGTKYKVQLTFLDNKSDPVTASQQARTLFLKDNVVALLGSATPALDIPISNVAEQLKRPVIQTVDPVEAWLGARTSGWNYAWDIFFDENQSTRQNYGAANLIKTNKRVALFTDTEEDGITMGAIWAKEAPTYGYTIAYHASFPVGTTDFSSQIAAAQAAHADILIAQMLPPDAIALWKQMKALSYQPKAAFCEKCASNSAWSKSLGAVAEGTMNNSIWDPSVSYPQASAFETAYSSTWATPDLGVIVYSYTAAKVTMDAINKAQSLDPDAINTAVGQVSGLYPAGQITFGANHAAITGSFEEQWQNGKNLRIYPQNAGANIKIETPVPGLG